MTEMRPKPLALSVAVTRAPSAGTMTRSGMPFTTPRRRTDPGHGHQRPARRGGATDDQADGRSKDRHLEVVHRDGDLKEINQRRRACTGPAGLKALYSDPRKRAGVAAGIGANGRPTATATWSRSTSAASARPRRPQHDRRPRTARRARTVRAAAGRGRSRFLACEEAGATCGRGTARKRAERNGRRRARCQRVGTAMLAAARAASASATTRRRMTAAGATSWTRPTDCPAIGSCS